METSQQPPTTDRALPLRPEIVTIHQKIGELASAVLSLKDAPAIPRDDAMLRLSGQAGALRAFKDHMSGVQRKAMKAVNEVETKLGPMVVFMAGGAHSSSGSGGVTDGATLQNLPGIDPNTELNRVLGRAELDGKPSYKLRDIITARLPPSMIIPRIVVADNDGTGMPSPPHYGNSSSSGGGEGHVVVLQPTLRNVWVLQHAYAKLLNHKEDLIKKYLAAAAAEASRSGVAGPPMSRKFAREYYEHPSLANLPSKDKLGNLLDVKSSTYHSDATGDVMLVLASMPPRDGSSSSGGFPIFTEAVTGDVITMNVDHFTTGDASKSGGGGAHLVLPATEASIRKLYDAYRALRGATSEQRRASKDKAFAAQLPVDEVAELEKQFNFGGASSVGGDGSGGGNTMGRKRRRMLDDVGEGD